ncbi:N-acetylneuraminate synthase family protein [Paracoccus sp. (in: a-proteobacteria)]|uniref:N-acetylneuraminate synthase family protein n=1 Tax=Paracoccus sp. TaxID=267 RepID=UPI0028AB555B|nr:N-acetylneuraminate synthase family protein [Paracoccus sp. (in: a-proteobacteria)]
MTDNFSSLVGAIASTYGTDTIFILGKGPSADDVPPEVFSGSLVIGLNDAERIYPADISIFRADWVVKALEENGCRAQLYLTSTGFCTSPGHQVLHAPNVPLTQETADLMIQRLLSKEFVIEDVLFMSALRVAREVAELRGRPQKVYMVGFDFQPELGYAHVHGKQFIGGDEKERALHIGMQENYFLNALYMLHGSGLDVHHVGARPYSRLTSEELIATFRHDIAGKHPTRDWQVSIIAELTTNHFGDRNRMERMIRAAHAAGADFIKVQKRNVETFYSAEQLAAPYRSPFGSTFGDYRRQIELTGDDFTFLDALCKQLGIGWFVSVLDEPSYNFVLDFNPPLIKLPSTISEHTDYLSSVAANTDRGIVLSTGMTDKAYEKWVLETFCNVPRLYLMQANSAYPSPARDCNVGVVRHYHRLSKSNPKIVPAYSSHDEGWFGSVLAVAAGARMVEKHVKFGNSEWAHFDAVALDLTTLQFRDYVAKLREAEILVGSEEKAIAPSEHHKYRRS